ncbi:DUF4241 domain-containing protein [Nannocystis punicea]|uniref:DUF4241 domain-containing protein n=1 Tax=Nannocystis punicea TaxID=2995304 RepID=A0ABY7GT25_9BACT|nr:DUF4241 domain-containing protein [Nannocystis poenicansa]WAS90079.1 DUF4241 domain-containing protein [Nannocystis poenicansa]
MQLLCFSFMARPQDRRVVQGGPFARMEAELLAPEGDGWRVRIVMLDRPFETVVSGVHLGLEPAPPPSVQIRATMPPWDPALLFASPDAVFGPPGAVTVRPGPALRLTSGRIVGFDPTNAAFLAEDYAPYERSVAPGLYPSWVCVDRGTGNVCAVKLRFADRPVARWSVAGVAPADHLRIASRFNTPPTQSFAYECRGFAALVDADARTWIREHADALPGDVLEAMVGAPADRTARAPDQVLRFGDDDLGPELLVLRAHDGRPCRAWWGEDHDGELVALVADLYSRGYHRARATARARASRR